MLGSGVYVGGPEVAEFERSFAEYCGTRFAVGVANGLEALELTLRAWGVGPRDEVIVPANTAVPTALAVTHAGARLVLADVEPDTGLLSAATVRAALSAATRVVVPVHLYGHPVDMDEIGAVAAEAGARVLEDAAHAHGARYRGRRCGSLADAAGFSFYPTKNLGALGDAGCITTDDAALASELRLLRAGGLTTNYRHERKGLTSRLDPLQAALLSWKLAHLDDWNERRRRLAQRYLADLDRRRGRDAAGGTAVGGPRLACLPDPRARRAARRSPARAAERGDRDEHPLPAARPRAAVLRRRRLARGRVSGQRSACGRAAEPAAGSVPHRRRDRRDRRRAARRAGSPAGGAAAHGRRVREVVLFGIGSPLVAEYEETCRRLGISIVAGVRNRPGPTHLGAERPVLDAGALPPAVLAAPCLCPLFTPCNRRDACAEAAAAGFRFAPALIDPTAVVASSSTFGEGTFVNAGCVVGARTRVAEQVVVNRGASIGHHVEIGAYVSLGPSAVICGNVTIEAGATIGAAAVVLPSVRIGAGALVGAGSVVVDDVPAGVRAIGNPARVRPAAPAPG